MTIDRKFTERSGLLMGVAEQMARGYREFIIPEIYQELEPAPAWDAYLEQSLDDHPWLEPVDYPLVRVLANKFWREVYGTKAISQNLDKMDDNRFAFWNQAITELEGQS